MKLALAFVLSLFLFAPVAAAEADVAFLQRLAGSWQGSGKLTGDDAGTITCRLSLKPNGARLTYSGRCGVRGQGSQSFQGTIVYNDKARRYEARSRGQVAVGSKSGNTLTFSFTGKTVQGNVTSTMRFSPSALRVDFRTVGSRGTMQARIPFSRS